MEYNALSENEERIGRAVVNAAYKVHKELGPGLLEKVYEACLAYELRKAGFQVRRQVKLPIIYDGVVFDEGLKADIIVEDLVVLETKAVDTVNPVWLSQIISHLRLTRLRLGYLINFNVPTIKQGIRRVIN
jgi:GxxExxY protein